MPKEIAARRMQRRWLSPIAVAVMLAMAAGCATAPIGLDPKAAPTPGIAASTTAGQYPPVVTRGGPAFGLGRSTDIRRTTGPIVDTNRDRRLRDNQLQRQERMVGGRIRTIDRQLDTIDMRRWQRLAIEPHRRYRPEPRQVLLEQERRRLQFEGRSIQRERDRLEFERRIDRSSRDPFTNTRRFPSRSIIQR